jgi:hypothetical protein
MADSDFGNPTPQFGTAEYAPKSGTDVCKSCNQGISGQYFRVNGSLACSRCVDQLKNQIPKDTHALFVRGLAFGFGGAILGLILYSGFSIITGIEIGYVSLAVGWIIAKAVKMGSRGTAPEMAFGPPSPAQQRDSTFSTSSPFGSSMAVRLPRHSAKPSGLSCSLFASSYGFLSVKVCSSSSPLVLVIVSLRRTCRRNPVRRLPPISLASLLLSPR